MLAAIDWNNSSRLQQQDEDGAQKRHALHEAGEAFVVRNVYTHVKTDRVGDLMRRVSQVHRDKAVLPDFARSEIPENVATIQKLQDAFYAIRTLNASTVVFTHYDLSVYAHMETHLHTHTHIAYDFLTDTVINVIIFD